MNVGRVVVGVLIIAVIVGLFVMKLQTIRTVWSTWSDVFKRRR